MIRLICMLFAVSLATAAWAEKPKKPRANAKTKAAQAAKVPKFEAGLTRAQKVAVVQKVDAAVAKQRKNAKLRDAVAQWQALSVDQKLAALDGKLGGSKAAVTTTGPVVVVVTTVSAKIDGLTTRRASKAELDYLDRSTRAAMTGGHGAGRTPAKRGAKTNKRALDY